MAKKTDDQTADRKTLAAALVRVTTPKATEPRKPGAKPRFWAEDMRDDD